MTAIGFGLMALGALGAILVALAIWGISTMDRDMEGY